MITVKPVTTKKEFKKFTKFRLDLYKDNPYCVPPLYSDERDVLMEGRNPAHKIYEHEVFVAERDGKIVGRIVAIINQIANRKEGVDFVRFGFIDFIDDDEVAEVLINTVEEWGRSRGMTAMHGPLGFTDFDPEGMLTWGFEELSTAITIYNYPYYPRQLERLGFREAARWLEYKIPIPSDVPEKYVKIATATVEKFGLRVLKFKSVSQVIKQGYGHKLFHLLNLAYADLYGFSQLTDELIDFYIKRYVSMLRLELLTFVVDENNELVAFGVALPSMSKALQKARGRLFPFGFIPLMRALKGKAEVCDLMLIAAHPDYRSMGVVALLFTELIPQMQKIGAKYAESNPELEDNIKVRSLWKDFNPVIHKHRAVFMKEI